MASEREITDLSAAYSACLDPDYPNPPTEQQKSAVLYDIVHRAGIRNAGWKPGMTESELAFLEGNRNLGLYIVNKVEKDPLDPKKRAPSHE